MALKVGIVGMGGIGATHARCYTHDSLAELVAQITVDATLTTRQRQEVCSALRVLGRAIGRRLEEISAHPGQLRERNRSAAAAATITAPTATRCQYESTLRRLMPFPKTIIMNTPITLL